MLLFQFNDFIILASLFLKKVVERFFGAERYHYPWIRIAERFSRRRPSAAPLADSQLRFCTLMPQFSDVKAYSTNALTCSIVSYLVPRHVPIAWQSRAYLSCYLHLRNSLSNPFFDMGPFLRISLLLLSTTRPIYSY
jgi:hypothetical protein